MAEASVSADQAELLLEQLEEELVKIHTALMSKQRPPGILGINVNQQRSFGEVNDCLSYLKKYVEDAQCVLTVHMPQSKARFLKYFRYLTLDPNTAHRDLILSEKNRAVRYGIKEQQYSDLPERFDYWPQVLSRESVSGRCYWEVEWESDIGVAIAVIYKGIKRKGAGEECKFARTNQSWSLEFPSASSVCFCHNNIVTDLRAPSSSRIGVYVDHSAGILSFYSVSDTRKLLHKVRTTFTQPLYAGFGFYRCGGSESGRTISLCDPK